MDDLELLAEGGLSITEDDLAAYALRHEENAEREAWMQTEDGADARAEDLVEEGATADAAEAGAEVDGAELLQVPKSPGQQLIAFCEKCEYMPCSEIESELSQMNFGKAELNTVEPEARRPPPSWADGSMAAEVKGLEDEEKLFDFSGRIGKLFLKVHAKGTNAHIEYNVKSDHAFKEEYRAEWQAILCTIFIVGKIHTKTQIRVDSTKGKFMDFGSLVETFGIHYNRERAIRLGKIHAAKCVMLKQGFVKKDTLAGCTLFLKLESEWAEEFTQAWQTYEKTNDAEGNTSGNENKGDQAPSRISNVAACEKAALELKQRRDASRNATGADGASSSSAPKATEKKAAKKPARGAKEPARGAKEPASSAKNTGGSDEETDKGRGGKKVSEKRSFEKMNLDELLMAAKKLKNRHNPAQSKFTQILGLLGSEKGGKDWQSKRIGEDHIDCMISAEKEIQASMTEFESSFLLSDGKIADLKTQMTESALQVGGDDRDRLNM